MPPRPGKKWIVVDVLLREFLVGALFQDIYRLNEPLVCKKKGIFDTAMVFRNKL